METFAIPLFFYTTAPNLAEAQRIKQALEQQLANPVLKTFLESNRIPTRGFVVQEPQLVPTPR